MPEQIIYVIFLLIGWGFGFITSNGSFVTINHNENNDLQKKSLEKLNKIYEWMSGTWFISNNKL